MRKLFQLAIDGIWGQGKEEPTEDGPGCYIDACYIIYVKTGMLPSGVTKDELARAAEVTP